MERKNPRTFEKQDPVKCENSKITYAIEQCGFVNDNVDAIIDFVDKVKKAKTSKYGAVNAETFIQLHELSTKFITVDLKEVKYFMQTYTSAYYEPETATLIRYCGAKAFFNAVDKTLMSDSEYRDFVTSIVMFALNFSSAPVNILHNLLMKVNKETSFTTIIRIFYLVSGIHYLPKTNYLESIYADSTALLDRVYDAVIASIESNSSDKNNTSNDIDNAGVTIPERKEQQISSAVICDNDGYIDTVNRVYNDLSNGRDSAIDVYSNGGVISVYIINPNTISQSTTSANISKDKVDTLIFNIGLSRRPIAVEQNESNEPEKENHISIMQKVIKFLKSKIR